jgi:methylmalonyl-CoA mutase cobalamin-binding domain/chain
MTKAIRAVGEQFNRGELWLPDLIRAADVFKAALPILMDEIHKKRAVIQSLGTVVIGTVKGDIHNIGKDMVATLLSAEGFTVFDLGIDISVEKFTAAVQKNKADIIAMSALLTTTAPEQKRVVDSLTKSGIRDVVKIMVGGGAITQQFADSIGADGYAPTAPLAVKLAKNLLAK